LYVVKPTTTYAPGQTGVIVRSGESYQLAPGYEDHAGAERGVVICDDDGTVTTLGDEDPRLIFVDRGTV
jgi:hypothetical protein